MIRHLGPLNYRCPRCVQLLSEVVDDNGQRGVGCVPCNAICCVMNLSHRSIELAICAIDRHLSRRNDPMDFLKLFTALAPLLAGHPDHPHTQEARVIAHQALDQHMQPAGDGTINTLLAALGLLAKASPLAVPLAPVTTVSVNP